MNNIRWKQKTFIFTALLLTSLLGACSQGRKSILAGERVDELWTPQSLCANSMGGAHIGCFEVQLNVSANVAYVDVLELGFNPGQTAYRILARPADSGTFQVLVNGEAVSAPVGSYIEVRPWPNRDIRDYEEWRIELLVQKDSSGLNLVEVSAGNGVVVAQDILNWSELFDSEGNFIPYD